MFIAKGPTEIRTRVSGFKVLSDNRYTMGPTMFRVWQYIQIHIHIYSMNAHIQILYTILCLDLKRCPVLTS